MAWKTENGTEKSYDGGRFNIRVLTDYTTTAQKFKIYVRVSDDFKNSHKCKITWVNSKGTPITKTPSKKLQQKDTYNILNSKVYTNGDYKTTIKCTIGNKTSSITITSSQYPPKPAKVVAKYVNDNHIDITVNGYGKPQKPVRALQLYRKDDYALNTWSALGDPHYFPTGTTGGTISNYTDVLFQDRTVEAGHKYCYAVEALNGTELERGSGKAQMSKKGDFDWIFTQPPSVSDVASERISDTDNLITFTRDTQAVDRQLITRAIIERSESGSEWIKIATIGVGSAASAAPIEYHDKTATINNYYSYRVRTVNPQLEASTATEEGGTEATYNTPAAPTEILATYETGSSNVKLQISEDSRTATYTEIQRSVDGGPYTDLVEPQEGVLTEYTDENVPSGSQLQYRVRYTRDDLASPWTVSNIPLTLTKANPPTLILPINGSPITLTDDTIRLAWIHNAVDGTAQTAARIRYKINDGAFSTLATVGAESYYDFPLMGLSANDTITWFVQTKGQYNTYSDNSEYSTFTVYAKPQLSITAPANGDTIGSLPLDLSINYTDQSGSLDKLTLYINKDGETVYKEDLDIEEINFEITGFLFENNAYYELQVEALSTSGLSTTDAVTVYIDYDIVSFTKPWLIDAEVDEEGRVTFNVSEGEEAEAGLNVTVDRAYIYRVVNGVREKIAEVHLNEQITDLYAPLNVDFDYEILEQAVTGEIMVIEQSFNIPSLYWYIYYGKDYDKVARAQWNPNGSVKLDRPEREEIRYSGRIYPVSYDSVAVGESYSFSAVIDNREDLNGFIALMRESGNGIWKSGSGECYNANFTFEYSADYTNIDITWNCSLEVTRID